MGNTELGLYKFPIRRSLPCIALILFLWPVSMAFSQHHTAHLRVRQTASQSLTLIKPTDSDFEYTLEAHFPLLPSEDNYTQMIKPWLVIVQNNTALPAVAYAITWAAHYADGSVRRRRAVFVNRPLMYQPAATYIPAGGLRLIAPMFNVTPKGYAWFKSFGQMYPANDFPGTDQLSSVDVTVDGVVYQNGSFIGPNKTHILQRYVAARFAARDEILEALRFIQSSTMPPLVVGQQLVQLLNQEIQRDATARKITLLARYVRARGRSARDVKDVLSRRGVSGLQKAFQAFINHQGGNQNASMFDKDYRNLSNDDPRVF